MGGGKTGVTMAIKKTINFSKIESVVYSFDEAEIYGALLSLIGNVYSVDPHKSVNSFEVGYDEDGHMVAKLTMKYTTETEETIC